jgi:peptidoglycan/xylan/chitin deacetylase (PgdA/CDA1 family)
MKGFEISRRQMLGAAAAALALRPRGSVAQNPASRRIAITIDDGPATNSDRDLAMFQKIVKGLRTALLEEKVPATIFINERQLNIPGERDARANALGEWLDAGFDLGNHAYSHYSANQDVWRFEDDIVKGEVIMRPLIEAHGKKLVWFRYPFLDSGTTPANHEAIMSFLAQRGYQVAHITVDYKDYMYAGAYARYLRAGQEDMAANVIDAMLTNLDVGFEKSEKLSQDLYGYELPQILLIHCSEMNSMTLRQSIDRMRRRGYSFITLEEATADPAYHRPDTFAGNGGGWLERTAKLQGKQPPGPSMERMVPDWIRPQQGQKKKKA